MTSIAAAAQPNPLRFGVYPYANRELVQSHFERLQDHLEVLLERPVEIIAPPNYSEFLKRAVNDDFEIAYVPPHLAGYLRGDHGFRLLAMAPSAQIDIVVSVMKQSPVQGPADLRGKKISAPPRLSRITIAAIALLERSGLRPGVDYEIVYRLNGRDAILDMVSGRSDAALSSSGLQDMVTRSLAAEFRAVTREVGEISIEVLGCPKYPMDDLDRVAAALIAYEDRPGGFTGSNEFLVFDFKKPDSSAITREQHVDLVEQMLEQLDLGLVPEVAPQPAN